MPAKAQAVLAPKSALSGPKLDDANQPIPLCNECGEALNFKGICPACGWTASAKKPVIAAKPGTPKPPSAPPKKVAPPIKPATTKPKASDDDELMEMALSSMNKPGAAKPPVKNTPVKKGEAEFWKEEK